MNNKTKSGKYLAIQAFLVVILLLFVFFLVFFLK